MAVDGAAAPAATGTPPAAAPTGDAAGGATAAAAGGASGAGPYASIISSVVGLWSQSDSARNAEQMRSAKAAETNSANQMANIAQTYGLDGRGGGGGSTPA